jgi:glycosyltransferase involved in cell wall biosynthesis
VTDPTTTVPPPRISVFIIAKNEVDRIARAILSVRGWADEVIVVDSGSEDDTVALSRSLGARTEYRAWTGYGAQKVYGESLCRNDWILNIDADEEVSPELGAEIRALLAADGDADTVAYRLPVLPLYPFQDGGHPWTVSNRPIRLYRKSRAGFDDSPVHDSVRVRQGRVASLRGMLVHRSFRSLEHHVDKMNAYTSEQARDWLAKGRNPSALTVLLTLPLSFFKSFFLRREFVNGLDGVVIASLYAIQRFLRVAKAREAHRLQRRAAPPNDSGDA